MNLLKNIYFVNKGQRCGQFLALVDFDKVTKNYSVLGLPESEALYITEKDINSGIGLKLLDLVETIPEDIHRECRNEFQFRINGATK